MSTNHNRSSPLPSCFRPNSAAGNDDHSTAEAPPPISGSNPNLTTCVYHTDIGLFSLTWSRTVLGRSLHLHLHLLLNNPSAADDDDDATTTTNTLSPSSYSGAPSFHLHIKPFIFWKKHGSKKLNINTSKTIQIFWDLSRAKFGSHPEPQSGYYVAVVVAGKVTLLVGDSPEEAYAKTRAKKPKRAQVMFLRREHVYGNKLYSTKASFGGRIRDISIDCRVGSSEEDPRLCFSVDQKMVLQVKHLKWKFRGNERIEVDGVYIQVSWDVYNWLFENDEDGFALFMFRFEKLWLDDDRQEEEDDDSELIRRHLNGNNKSNNGTVFWSQQSCGFGFEKKKMKMKMKKSLLMRTARSSSSSSLSSASSSGCSSVMEWASMEENELKSPSEFSLLVYAWKSSR